MNSTTDNRRPTLARFIEVDRTKNALAYFEHPMAARIFARHGIRSEETSQRLWWIYRAKDPLAEKAAKRAKKRLPTLLLNLETQKPNHP